MIVITQGKGSLWVEGARDIGGVLLSFVMKFMPVRAGAAIFCRGVNVLNRSTGVSVCVEFVGKSDLVFLLSDCFPLGNR